MINTANIAFVDGDFTIATPIAAPVFSSPFPGVAESLVMTLAFQQFNEWWEPVPINTGYNDSVPPAYQNPDYEDFVLCSENERQDIGGAIVQWTRTYAKVPDQRTEGSSYSYSYPGLVGTYTPTGGGAQNIVTLRLPIQLTPTCKIVYEYFLVGLNGTYADFLSIPRIAHTQFYIPILNGISEVGKQDVTILGVSTVPTTTEYQTAQGDGSLIVAEDSQVSRWMGDIFQRVTKYIPYL